MNPVNSEDYVAHASLVVRNCTGTPVNCQLKRLVIRYTFWPLVAVSIIHSITP